MTTETVLARIVPGVEALLKEVMAHGLLLNLPYDSRSHPKGCSPRCSEHAPARVFRRERKRPCWA